jgi:hypothetical protein
MPFEVHPAIEQKLAIKHQVTVEEVNEATANRVGNLLEEMRPANQGTLKRYWFISETNRGRKLKVVFATDGTGDPILITAYSPNVIEEKLYESKQNHAGRAP